jgi:hypothetical protein
VKDKRVLVFRIALDELVESLDATLRIMRWESSEAIPQPLEDSASQLVARLGTADRLAGSVFKGRQQDVLQVTALTGAMRHLETAYVEFRRKLNSPTERARAESALDAAIDEAKVEAQNWAQ